jgi:hypothetical protein
MSDWIYFYTSKKWIKWSIEWLSIDHLVEVKGGVCFHTDKKGKVPRISPPQRILCGLPPLREKLFFIWLFNPLSRVGFPLRWFVFPRFHLGLFKIRPAAAGLLILSHSYNFWFSRIRSAIADPTMHSHGWSPWMWIRIFRPRPPPGRIEQVTFFVSRGLKRKRGADFLCATTILHFHVPSPFHQKSLILRSHSL